MQKRSKEGFTLIELLAVIVILAIIALIAVPVIMNVITKARKSAFEDSAYGIVKAGELYYSNQLLEPEGMTESKEFTIENGTFTSAEKLDVSGSLPSSGKVTVTSEGKVALAIPNGEYCIRKATTESKVKAEKLSDLGGVCNYKTVFTTASDGTEVPACITNNTTCSADDIKNGLKVGVKVNNSETKDFYVISEDAENNKITLITTQDLFSSVWISDKDYKDAGGKDLSNDGGACEYGGSCVNVSVGPITLLNELEKQTANWTNIPLETYTLIGKNDSYQVTRTARAHIPGETEMASLGCTASGGCPLWLNSGWWTSIADGISASVINGRGGENGVELYLDADLLNQNNGIRPVITISKNIL